jgi:hypothetical protein
MRVRDSPALARQKRTRFSLRDSEAQRSFQVTLVVWNGVFALLRLAFIGVVVMFVSYFGCYRTAGELAGKDTNFNGSLSALAKVMVNKHASEGIAYLVALLTGGAYVRHKGRERRKMRQAKAVNSQQGGRRAA